MRLVIPGPEAAEACVRFNRENRDHLAPWSPLMTVDALDIGFYERTRRQQLAVEDRGYHFAIFFRSDKDSHDILGWVNLNNIVRGAFQASHLGYSLSAVAEGRGIMTEALRAVIPFAFDDLQLHRIMANHMPHNIRSAAVLKRLGFEIEGRAKAYLYIAGAWRDHVLTSLNNPNPLPPQRFASSPARRDDDDRSMRLRKPFAV
ncbi:MAG: GNAT family N-acetyltransferase [Candidatus Eremiobacteraeota bacterium]|nr:GNAT family N-acetyltransferase [Candidatus Eremiobacteraeota bacterium]